jgi:hypothetical protein
VLGGEVVAFDADGHPNFARLHVRWTRPNTFHQWALGLPAFNGRDLPQQPLVTASHEAIVSALKIRYGLTAF